MQPLLNPIGFGASDFLELALAAALLFFALLRPWAEPFARRLADRPGWCMALLAALPVALRLALLPHHPVPTPDIYDEFSHLLVADTLRHFRLANPPHPLHQFFETFFVLQQPAYSSIYPLGQGLMLAVGRMIFGLPWAGVLLATGAFCALCYWMLRAWTTPLWALAGGLLAVMEFGPLNPWMNGYWGGAMPAMAGCLVFGALPRVQANARKRDGALLGLGLALHALTRPFESIFVLLGVIMFLLPAARRLARPLLATALAALPALLIAAAQNKAVTGSWTMLPYSLSQYQYGVPSTLTFQPNPVAHRELTPQQELDYKMQLSFHGPDTDTLRTYLTRLVYRMRFYRFYFLPPLYVALMAFLLAWRDWRFAWVLFAVTLLALGVNFFPAFRYHYLAGATCLFILMSVVGLRQLRREAALLILFLCAFHFVFWYGLHLFEDPDFSLAMRRFETWDSINHSNPEGRILIRNQLAQTSGKQLVLVRYWPQHIFQTEWVYNDADIDAARIVWARELGPVENQKARDYYHDRTVWLLEPDAQPPKLTRYDAEPLPPPQAPQPAPVIETKTEAPKRPVQQPTLRFEQVK